MIPSTMDTLPRAASTAVQLIVTGNAEFYSVVATSLRVSLTATVIASVVGAPLGALLAVRAFWGRRPVLIAANAMMGLPPVVVGLIVYLLLSRAGPLGSLGLLFTVRAMILAQVFLTLPIVVALTHRLAETSWGSYGDALRIDGASTGRCIWSLLMINATALVTVFLAAFGRAIAEVGAIMIVGGNIRGHTRTMTTTIALETSKGDLAVALGLGGVLIALTVLISTLAFLLERHLAK